jgi:hypothetical protein
MKKLIALMIAIPLFAGGKAWMSLGYGTSSQIYDTDGNAQDLNGSYNTLNIHLGGVYDVFSIPAMLSFFGGADVGLEQLSFSPDTGSSVSSGFSPQNITFFVGAKGLFFKGMVGFLLDIGPKPDPETEPDKEPNTDQQNAIMIGLSGMLPNPIISLAGGISYFLTLETEKKVFVPSPTPGYQTMKYDEGDIFALWVKGGYKFGLGEAGLKVIYRMRTAIKVEGNEVTDSDGNHLSIIPYVVVSPPMLPVSFFLKGAVMDEYLPYGFSVMGKNSPVTRVGLTLGGYIKF